MTYGSQSGSLYNPRHKAHCWCCFEVLAQKKFQNRIEPNLVHTGGANLPSIHIQVKPTSMVTYPRLGLYKIKNNVYYMPAA
jgi:hypothetical protein